MNISVNAAKSVSSRSLRLAAGAFLLAALCTAPALRAQDTSSSGGQDAPAPSPISASAMASNPEGITGISLSLDFGQMTTQFGSNVTKAYTYPQRSSTYVDFDFTFDYALAYYTNGSIYTGLKLDAAIPFDQSDATGNPLEVGITGGIYGDYRGVSIGTGIEARNFSLPAEGSFARNAQLLYGIPASADINIKRLLLRGGGTFWLANIDGGLLNSISTDPTDGSITTTVLNNTVSTLSSTQSSYDLKGSAAYRVTDSLWLSFNYLHRQVYFDLAGEVGSNDPNIMNFTQNQISGGIYFHPKF